MEEEAEAEAEADAEVEAALADAACALDWLEGFFLRKPKGLRDFLAAASLEPLRVAVEVAAEGGVRGRSECCEREEVRLGLSMLARLESLKEYCVVPVPLRGRVRMTGEAVAGLAALAALAAVVVVVVVVVAAAAAAAADADDDDADVEAAWLLEG